MKFKDNWRSPHEFKTKELFASLRYVTKSVSKDETRNNLRGVFWEGSQLVAVDGHRLHIAKFHMKKFLPIHSSFILSLENCKEMIKRYRKHKEIRLTRGNKYLHVRSDSGYSFFELTKEKFPPYSHVIPVCGCEVVFDSKELLGKVKELKKKVKETFPRIIFEIKDNLSLSYEDSKKKNSAEFEIDFSSKRIVNDCNFVVNKNGYIKFGINLSYVIDSIIRTSEEVSIQYIGPKDPIVVTNKKGGEFAVIMPTRI